MHDALTVDAAIERLHAGAVLAYPTEAVWGLGCDPFDQAAVMRLLSIKQRAVEKGLILVAATTAQLDDVVDWAALEDGALHDVRESWPGPHTWVVPSRASVPPWITGRHDGVAVRVSAHPVVAALCHGFGGVLVSTSANTAGEPAPRTRAQIEPALSTAVDGVVGGETSGGSGPTPIRDARSGTRLRS